MYAHMYVCMYACMRVCMHVCIYKFPFPARKAVNECRGMTQPQWRLATVPVICPLFGSNIGFA